MEITDITKTGFRVSVETEYGRGELYQITTVCESQGVRLYPAMGEEDDKGTFLDIQFVDTLTLGKVGDIIRELQTGITPPSYMVTTNRGSGVLLEPMRFFTGARAELEARAYVASIPREDGTAVMYEVRHNAPPVKVKGVYQGRASRGT